MAYNKTRDKASLAQDRNKTNRTMGQRKSGVKRASQTRSNIKNIIKRSK